MFCYLPPVNRQIINALIYTFMFTHSIATLTQTPLINASHPRVLSSSARQCTSKLNPQGFGEALEISTYSHKDSTGILM